MRLRLPVPEAERSPLTRFVLTFGGLVAAWACLHDLYLIQVEPRHFTDYHRPLLPVGNHALLAVQYACVATLGPGLAFGFLAWLACRGGPRPAVSLRRAASGFACLMISVECLLYLLGELARLRTQAGAPPLYPLWAYPDLTPGILVSQTVNISAYLIAPAAGALYLLALFLGRRRAARD